MLGPLILLWRLGVIDGARIPIYYRSLAEVVLLAA
jgi:hypothetical protein